MNMSMLNTQVFTHSLQLPIISFHTCLGNFMEAPSVHFLKFLGMHLLCLGIYLQCPSIAQATGCEVLN